MPLYTLVRRYTNTPLNLHIYSPSHLHTYRTYWTFCPEHTLYNDDNDNSCKAYSPQHVYASSPVHLNACATIEFYMRHFLYQYTFTCLHVVINSPVLVRTYTPPRLSGYSLVTINFHIYMV